MKTEAVMPFDVGRYLRDTMGLTSSEHGSYMLLIMAYWSNAGPLKNDDRTLRAIARCPDAEWARTKGIMEQYFVASNGVWKHTFLDKEIAKSVARKKQLMDASAKGIEARRELGQIAPVGQPSGVPSGSISLRISQEKELDRVEHRIEEIRKQGTVTASGTVFSVPQKAELKALKDRREQLKKSLGFMA